MSLVRSVQTLATPPGTFCDVARTLSRTGMEDQGHQRMLAALGRGVAWTYTSMGVSGVLQVAVVAMTARLLPPEAFGLIAMANVILRFGSYYARMGVGKALIQRASIDDQDVRAAFTSSTALGLLTAATIIALAPLAALYFRTDEVVPVLRWLALTFVFSGIGATARALLQRHLRFRATSIIEVASYAFGYALPTLTLASAGFGVWSLVAGAIGQAAFSTVASMLLSQHSLRPTLRRAAHQRLLGFGIKVSSISLLEFIGASLDSLVIGRFGTAAQLGVYNRAFMLASLPTYHVNHGISKVLFPVLSGGRADTTAFATTLETASRTAIKLVLPLGIGMALAAEELVHVVLGEGWSEAVPLFAILAPALAVNLLSAFPGQALEVMARLRTKAVLQLAYVVLLGSVLFLLAFGPIDLGRITLAIAISISLRTVAMYVLIFRTGVVPSSVPIALLRTAVIASVATVAAMLPVLTLSRRLAVPDVTTLALAIAAGALVLAVLFRSNVLQTLRKHHRPRL